MVKPNIQPDSYIYNASSYADLSEPIQILISFRGRSVTFIRVPSTASLSQHLRDSKCDTLGMTILRHHILITAPSFFFTDRHLLEKDSKMKTKMTFHSCSYHFMFFNAYLIEWPFVCVEKRSTVLST